MNNQRIMGIWVLIVLCVGSALGQNPIIQTCYTADPAPFVYKDTVFLYTGHDEDKSTWFTMNDWKVFSSVDMVNWTSRGTPLSLKTFSWAKRMHGQGSVLNGVASFTGMSLSLKSRLAKPPSVLRLPIIQPVHSKTLWVSRL
ncbi:glycoside hydrolase family protein [Arachidicoccus ginsenosidivorans]|uniref:hypothetical protein n=1 Tax=Arachidicoccus ginsenosidivorans TaxID=496057 RepID=UPI001CEF793A|nr:hypothetical protein [Arachidicoccus ginsenosidivorans]